MPDPVPTITDPDDPRLTLRVYEIQNPPRDRGWWGDTPNGEFHAARHPSKESVEEAHARYVRRRVEGRNEEHDGGDA